MSSTESPETRDERESTDEEVVAHAGVIDEPGDADPERKRKRKRKRKQYEDAGDGELGRKRK